MVASGSDVAQWVNLTLLKNSGPSSKAGNVTTAVYGISHSDSHFKADILNQQFSPAFTNEDTTSIPDMGPSSADINIHEPGGGLRKIAY